MSMLQLLLGMQPLIQQAFEPGGGENCLACLACPVCMAQQALRHSLLLQVVEKEHVKEQQKAEDMHWSELNEQDRLAKEFK